MRCTAYKESNCKHSEANNDDGDVDLSLFEEILSIIDCDDPLFTDTNCYTHAMISTEHNFLNEVYVIAPFNNNSNVLIGGKFSIIDQEDAQNDNNEIDVTIRGGHVSVESMIKIITKIVLGFHDIFDDAQSVDLSSTNCTTSYEIDMLKRYIREGRLDEKQSMEIIAICSTLVMLSHVNFTTNRLRMLINIILIMT